MRFRSVNIAKACLIVAVLALLWTVKLKPNVEISLLSNVTLPNYDVSCSHVRRPTYEQVARRHGAWQIQTLGTAGDDGSADEVAVFSAFFDDRNLFGNETPTVRVNAVRPAAFESRKLFCYVWYADSDRPVVTDVETTRAGGMGHIVTPRQVLYAQYLYSCRLPIATRAIPTHVSLIDESHLGLNATTLLRVVRGPPRVTARREHQFVTCTETSFGDIPPEKIVEWIEANRIFGVTLFNIYNGNITNDATLRTLQWYDNRGIVRLKRLPPAVDDDTLEGVKLSSPTSFNDCLMRNMHSTRFIVVLDFDELIVPRRLDLTDYSSLVAAVDAYSGVPVGRYHTYVFRNTYFFKSYPPDDRQPAYLTSLRYRMHAPPSPFTVSPKAFVDPTRCLSLFNHYCLVQLPGADSAEYDTIVGVPQEIGLSHHYRAVCELEGTACDELAGQIVPNDVMLTYREKLLARVGLVLKMSNRF